MLARVATLDQAPPESVTSPADAPGLRPVAHASARGRCVGLAAAVLAGLGVLLGSGSSAFAATPVLIGSGNNPGVAVDGAGTAFIAYNDNDNFPAPKPIVHYCRLPRGGTVCDTRLDFALPGTTLSRPGVFVDGQTVRILAYRYGLTGGPSFALDFVMTSTDGGVTFSAPVEVGTVDPYNAVAGPGSSGISLVNTASNLASGYQKVDANGPLVTSIANLANAILTSAVGLVDPTTPLVAFDSLGGPVAFRVYGGSGDVNDVANWSAAQVIGQGSYERLAGGPSGLFLQLAATNTPFRLEIRRYNGSAGFGAPTSIPIGDGGSYNYLTQDPGGTLYSLWPDNTGVVGPRLRYATSPDGVSWRTGELVALAQLINRPWAAAAADHQGYAVFDTAQGVAQQVYAVPLVPVPPPPAAPALTPPAPVPPTQAKPKAALSIAGIMIVGGRILVNASFNTNGTVFAAAHVTNVRALTASAAKKPKRCAAGQVLMKVHGKKRCVSDAFGASTTTIPAAGVYRILVSPNAAARRALNKGKTLHVRETLAFNPAGGGTPALATVNATVKAKKKKKKKTH